MRDSSKASLTRSAPSILENVTRRKGVPERSVKLGIVRAPSSDRAQWPRLLSFLTLKGRSSMALADVLESWQHSLKPAYRIALGFAALLRHRRQSHARPAFARHLKSRPDWPISGGNEGRAFLLSRREDGQHLLTM